MKARDTSAGGLTARYLLYGSTFFLVLMGLVMVYSAAFASDYVTRGDSAHHFKRQIIWVCIGAVFLLLGRWIDYRKLRSASWLVWSASLLGLVVVFLMGVGKWGAQRWIDIGPVTIQPSEYAKLGCVMVTALLATQLKGREITQKEFWGRLLIATSAVTALVMLQPDMGTTVSIVLAVFIMLVLGGISWWRLGGIAGSGLVLMGAGILIAPYRAARLTAFLDPWADPQGGGYQTIQALLAFGSGGIDGVGLGLSRQKFFYLPAAHTDFIFAIIGEELGLIGTLAIVIAFGVFAYAGLRIALGARDRFGRLLAGGLTAMIVTQAVINMAAVTNLMPVTGIPMPLVSFGGSSMTFTLLCVGMILSVSVHGAHGVRAVRSPDSKENARAGDDERRRDRGSRLSRIGRSRGSARRRA